MAYLLTRSRRVVRRREKPADQNDMPPIKNTSSVKFSAELSEEYKPSRPYACSNTDQAFGDDWSSFGRAIVNACIRANLSINR